MPDAKQPSLGFLGGGGARRRAPRSRFGAQGKMPSLGPSWRRHPQPESPNTLAKRKLSPVSTCRHAARFWPDGHRSRLFAKRTSAYLKFRETIKIQSLLQCCCARLNGNERAGPYLLEGSRKLSLVCAHVQAHYQLSTPQMWCENGLETSAILRWQYPACQPIHGVNGLLAWPGLAGCLGGLA